MLNLIVRFDVNIYTGAVKFSKVLHFCNKFARYNTQIHKMHFKIKYFWRPLFLSIVVD